MAKRTVETQWGTISLNVSVCGECKKEVQAANTYGWLRVALLRQGIVLASDSPHGALYDAVFCTVECLAAFTARLHTAKAETVEGKEIDRCVTCGKSGRDHDGLLPR